MGNKKMAIISGAGSGIGRAIALHLDQIGWEVILTGRNLDKLRQTESMMTHSPRLMTLDIRKREEVDSCSRELKDVKLHAIIANAGIGGPNEWGEHDRWEDIIQTNLSGSYFFTQAFLPLLHAEEDQSAHILFVSSVLARLGVPGYTAYCASKAGLLGLMRSMAVEHAPNHILVNAICPGWVNTRMAREGIEGLAQEAKTTPEEFLKIAMQDVPLGKMSEADEIAQLCGYLLNQQSITGQTIDINNGSVMNS
jgi:NAD(P)-dependent dehydrogenase (short-subunit alcohol dehydrogenase family)